ncbi:hypothetical protein [endosymbiont GvMRE of Glomus versiforme]|uniref:hypothetical protein n=1 Tax=endosymbiont GvMRE of Glomus versiforme TaxID=2039283 RepID=UPI000EE7A335|nr:hypothetical protein [endosymbiont GvMRE of Glomus versiforme]RHZ35916.1 hypothetical protein GvMRE_Ic4g72 [endosymbiont GvMRE of Glomus versiforme]
MNQKQLNPHLNQNFICDSCQRKFQNETAYSPKLGPGFLTETYCVNCVEATEEKSLNNSKSQSKTKKPKKWEAPPLEASENLTSLNIDKRSLTKTGRVHQLGTRVRKEFLEQLKSIAYEERLKYVEVLEKALECYEKHKRKTKN